MTASSGKNPFNRTDTSDELDAPDGSNHGLNTSATQTCRIEKMAHEAVEIALAGDIHLAHARALEALNLARDSKNRTAELAAINAAACCHNLRYDQLGGLTVGMDALAMAENIGDKRAYAYALCSITASTFSLRLLNETLPISEHAIAEAIAHGDVSLEAHTRRIHGENLGDLGRLDEARCQLDQAMAAAQQTTSNGLINWVASQHATLSGKVAQHFAAIGQRIEMERACEDALQRAEHATKIAHQQNNVYRIVSMGVIRAKIHEYRGESAAERDETNIVLKLAHKHRYQSPIPPMSLRLARLQIAEGKFGRARLTLEKGLLAAEALRPTFRIGEICDAITRVAEQHQDHVRANHWRVRASAEKKLFERERERVKTLLLTRIKFNS